MVSVQKVTSGATVKCSLASSEPIGPEPMDHSLLKPGLLVPARVRSTVLPGKGSGGLVVRFCGITAVIHQHHTGQTEEVEWTKNQKVVARILAVLPEATPVVQLTLLPHVVDWVPEDLPEKAEIGELLVGDVVDFQPKYGCRVQLTKDGNEISGFCSMSKLADKDKDVVATSVRPGHGQHLMHLFAIIFWWPFKLRTKKLSKEATAATRFYEH